MIDVTLESVSKRFARAGDTAAVDDRRRPAIGPGARLAR